MPPMSNTKNQAPTFCVIVPTYNNQNTIKAVLQDILAITTHVIVINDGSTDSTEEILNGFTNILKITYADNQGKGHALKLGLNKAIAEGYDYAISIDSDGQHFASDIPKLVAKITKEPEKLIMGSRNMDAEGIPGKSSLGNRISNFWFMAETGIKLSDTQTGFRAYPLEPIKDMRFFTKKFEFEVEVIVRLAWKNVEFSEVPIRVAYPEERVSHFRPFQDFSRISVLHTIAFILAILFFLPRLLILNFSIKKIGRKLGQEFTKDINHPVKLSAAVGLGLFFGILPIWGFQMIVGFAVASYFKLNRALVLIFSNISLSPMIPIIIFASFEFGALFVNNSIHFYDFGAIGMDSITHHLTQYFIGAVLLAVLFGLSGFLLTWTMITFYKLVLNPD